MITVKYKQENQLWTIKVSGHAKYNDYGKDIVCAATSSIVITSVNACLSIDENSLFYKEDKALIEINQLSNNENITKILTNLIKMLEQLVESYPKNISLREEV